VILFWARLAVREEERSLAELARLEESCKELCSEVRVKQAEVSKLNALSQTLQEQTDQLLVQQSTFQHELLMMGKERSAHEDWRRDAAEERAKSCEALRAELEHMEEAANARMTESLRDLEDQVALKTADYCKLQSDLGVADIRISELVSKEERMRYSLSCMEADVQTAEDRCTQLQELCAEAHGRLDELGSAEANKEAELVEADLRLQSLQSLILAGNHKVLEAKSAIRLSLFWMAFAVEFDLLLRGYSRSTRCRYLLCDSFLGPTRREGGGAQPCRACKARGELECNGCYVG